MTIFKFTSHNIPGIKACVNIWLTCINILVCSRWIIRRYMALNVCNYTQKVIFSSFLTYLCRACIFIIIYFFYWLCIGFWLSTFFNRYSLVPNKSPPSLIYFWKLWSKMVKYWCKYWCYTLLSESNVSVSVTPLQSSGKLINTNSENVLFWRT